MVSRILFVGNVAYADALWYAIGDTEHHAYRCDRPAQLRWSVRHARPDLIVVGGWRHLIPPDVLALAPTVGFHSAKLPEYPGRAPVPWTLLRGDRYAWNTLLYLDEGVDSGDIVDTRVHKVREGETPDTLYDWIASSSVDMLLANLPRLLDGTAPRHRQDMARRGPLTTKDGWQHYWLRQQADGFG
jgi:methionyl-tRNA formyltransferase